MIFSRMKSRLKTFLTDAGYEVKDDQNVVVIGAGDLTLIDWDTWEKQEVPEGGIDLTLNLDTVMRRVTGIPMTN